MTDKTKSGGMIPIASPRDRSARYLGFAFASADLLFEVNGDGDIVFALGARQQVVGGDEINLVGAHWSHLVAERDHDLMKALLDQLQSPGRVGPVRLSLRPRAGRLTRHAAFSACKLDASAKTVFCVLSLAGGALFAPADCEPLLDRDAFLSAAPGAISRAFDSGIELILEVIDIQAAQRSLGSPEAVEAVVDSLLTVLRAESHAGAAVGRLAPDQFAVLRPSDGGAKGFTERLEQFAERNGVAGAVMTAAIPIDGRSPPISILRALRYTLDTVLQTGLSGDDRGGAGPTADLFTAAMEHTIAQAEAFQARVAARDFRLVFQPIVDLRSGLTRYYEALVRFNEDDSPAAMIHIAEELGLIEAFDLAVTSLVTRHLLKSRDPSLSLSFNVSARSLVQPDFMAEMTSIIDKAGAAVARKLIVELTETFRIDDLDLANEHIQMLRRRGVLVSLDDYGAGEASLRYLRRLRVDTVKIDGAYVREAAGSKLDQIMLRHVANLCRDLDITTVAEMIENEETAALALSVGVNMGQGWLFGGPQDTPRAVTPRGVGPAVRRTGEKVRWE